MKESWRVESNGVGVCYSGRQHALFGPNFRLNGSPATSHCGEMDMCTARMSRVRYAGEMGEGPPGGQGASHADGTRVFGTPGDRTDRGHQPNT